MEEAVRKYVSLLPQKGMKKIGGEFLCLLILLFIVLLLPTAINIEAKEANGSDNLSVNIDQALIAKATENPDEMLRAILIFKKKPSAYKYEIGLLGGRIIHDYSIIEGAAVEIPGRFVEKLKELEDIVSIQDDREVHALLTESIPLVNADDVLDLGYNGSGVKVCIIDTGIDYTHPALQERVIAQKCYCSPGLFRPSPCCPNGQAEDDDAMDDHGHGTHVAGIVASTDFEYKGVAPGASLMAVKVLDSNGRGYESDVIAGIDWCLNKSADVISLSLGGGLYSSHCDYEADAKAVNRAVDAGIVVSIASANDGSATHISAPACASKAISVGAVYDADVGPKTWCLKWSGLSCIESCTDDTTAPDKIVCFTNRNEILDLLAPGALITSTVLSNKFDTYAGTSMATPHVAGAVALLLETEPTLTPVEIDSILKETGVSIYDDKTGLTFPRVDVLAAFEFIGRTIKITIQTDKEVFDPEEKIFVSGTVSKKSQPISASLDISFLDNYDDLIEKKSTISQDGVFNTDFTVPSDAEPGTYSIKVDAEYNDETSSKIKEITIGSLIINLNRTKTVIPYNTTHTIEGYVYYRNGTAVANANVTAFVEKDDMEITISNESDGEGYFSMSWLPADYGTYEILVVAKDNSTNKVGKNDTELVVNPPVPGTLRVSLKDAEGVYIYDKSCPYAPSEKWYDIVISIYNQIGDRIVYNYNAKCEEGYNLTSGTYRVVVSGRAASYQNSYVLINQTVEVEIDKTAEVSLSSAAKLRITLKDIEGNYIYDEPAGCSHSPKIEWYDIDTYVYDEYGEKVAQAYYTGCEDGYYLTPGNYSIVISGKATYHQSVYALINQSISVAEGEVKDIDLTSLGKLKVTLKDAQGNYIHDNSIYASCPYSPSEKWNIARIEVYDESGKIAGTSAADCAETYYLTPGNYRVVISGKATYHQSVYVLLNQSISVAGGEVKDIDLTSLGKLKVTMKDAGGNYIHDNSIYASCPYSPSEKWSIVRIELYDETGKIAGTPAADCEEGYYLTKGNYTLCITAKENSGSSSITHCYNISIGRGICQATVMVDTGEFSYECFCSDDTSYGNCSATQPLYCDDGNLIDKCSQCGCPNPECRECQEDGSCKSIVEGDVNDDLTVNIFDLAAVGLAYGSQPGDSNWNPDADLNGDGVISIFDLATVGLNYGRSC